MIFVIACIYDSTKLVGFRLYDTTKYNTMEISYDKLYNGLARGIKVENIQIDGDKLKGKGGSLSRYTAITLEGYPFGEQAVTIVNKEVDNETNEVFYRVVDYKGNSSTLSSQELVKYTYCGKLSNGKVVCKNGTYIISAIDGEFAQQDEKKINTKYQTKYKLPELDRNKVAGTILEKDEFKKRVQKKFNWSMIKTKQGLIPKYVGYRHSSSIVAHDTLNATLDGSRYVNLCILELFYGNQKIYRIEANWNSYSYAYDIIYIGKRWKTLSDKFQHSDEDCEDALVITLGLTGLIIYIATEADLKQVILPYASIYSIKDIEVFIESFGYSATITPDDFARIQFIKELTPYKIKMGVNEAEIPRHQVYANRNVFESDGVEKLNRLDMKVLTNVNSCGTLYDVNEFFRESLTSELNAGINPGDLIYFSHSQKPFYKSMHTGYDTIRLLDKNDKLIININSTELKILGYYVLYLIKKVTYWSNAWLSNVEREKLRPYIWRHNVENGKLEVYADDIEIVYNLDKLLELYELDKQAIELKVGDTNKVRAKTKIVGTLVDFDDAGNIIDWEGDVRLKSSNTICGVVVSSSRDFKTGALIVDVVTPDFKVIDKKSGYGRDRDITLSFRKEYYGNSLKYIKDSNDIKIQYDLYQASLNDLKIIMALYIRASINRTKRIVIGKDTRYIEITDFGIGIEQLINKAGIIFGTDEQYRLSYRSAISITNTEEIDKSIKDEFIKECMKNINTKGKHVIQSSTQIVNLIIDALSAGDENLEYHRKLNKFLETVNKH